MPSQVQIVFSLRDQDGNAIVLPAQEVAAESRVFERPDGGNWEEIDHSESGYLVHTAENFQLEVVFVLDFTNSMAQGALPDGRSGIDAMLSAFESAVLSLPGTHRIGVVEFHDGNVDPSVLSPLTIDRMSVLDSVRRFAGSRFDHGSSRVWDSLVTGSNLFSQDTGVVRALVFLSGGRDSSSFNTREQAARYAKERSVQLYALGVGEVHEEYRLWAAAIETGGFYYRAQQVVGLEGQLQTIVSDLRGQYKMSYITLRRAGKYQAAVTITLRGAEGSFQTRVFDAARFFGPDNRGVVEFDPPSLDRATGCAVLFVRALHVPRNIDRIRFKLETNKPVAVELVLAVDGGLLDGWTLSGPDASGFYEASSREPIEFGNFGPLFRLTLSNVTERSLRVPIEFDNSIYAAGKEFASPAQITIRPRPRIALYSFRDANAEIYVMNADGSGQTRLTVNSTDDIGPRWSPDGRRIAFESHRDGNWEIYVMNADGSGQARLTDNSADDADPRWSPDGRRIAFESHRDGNWEIYVMNADGSGQTRLTDNSAVDAEPRWSPDGRRITFESYLYGNWEIYVMNADGSGQMRLTDNLVSDVGPRWSPDGPRIAFESDRDGNREIYVMNADGSGQTRLTDSSTVDAEPRWSPDGRLIAFYSDRDGNSEIYVMNADGSGQKRLTANSAGDFYPTWSPDGRRIAFESHRDGTWAIYVVNADESGQTRLTGYSADNGQPNWSPN